MSGTTAEGKDDGKLSLTVRLDPEDVPNDFIVHNPDRNPVIGEALPDGRIRRERDGAVVDGEGEPDDEPDDAGEAGMSADDPRRARRRQRRVRERESRETDRALIQSLRAQLDDQAAAIGDMRGQGTQAHIATMDSRIRELDGALQNAKAHHADAVEKADGARAAQALEAMFGIREQRSQLAYQRNATVQQAKQRNNGVGNVDRATASHADGWLRRNSWYDPDLQDADSRHASVVDEGLVAEGFDPRLPGYWQELDRRLAKVLPHRASNRRDLAPEHDDMADAPRTGRPPPMTGGQGRERSPSGTGSGRQQSSDPNTYRLSAERVAAAKEAGLWGDSARMARFIRSCIATDKAIAEERV